MKKLVLAIISFFLIITLPYEGAVQADYTCYSDGESSFCSSAVLDYAVVGGGFSTSSQCAAFCSPY